ncbi:MAG TPA: tRNA(His) guanylyltransferase Thg1 family protein [Leptospiraceae bacterium]|nr:tRNA(His) guanylyltransferase Thg1 family protein [Leptospiraceae bacterium]
MNTTTLGDRMKQYEALADQKLMPRLPVILRLDGKGFHAWTKGCKRPYDERLQNLMDEVTKKLVEETHSLVGYTQSDEITLILWNPEPKAEPYFGGRVNKLNSVAASMASAWFNRLVPDYLPEKTKLAYFDCRAFAVPSMIEAVNCLIFRELDATKNAVSMAAQSMFSHAELQHKNGSEMQEMMFNDKRVNFNDYPSRFKRGAYFKKQLLIRKFTAEELENLPEKHGARKNPDLLITRSVITKLELPPILKIKNPIEVFFEGKEVELYSEA